MTLVDVGMLSEIQAMLVTWAHYAVVTAAEQVSHHFIVYNSFTEQRFHIPLVIKQVTLKTFSQPIC